MQLLTEPQSSLDAWKQRLTDALGDNGLLITDIIPDLEQIIGLQPQVTELNPVEAQNRVQMVFLEFIKVFAQKEHPLVIFLDDFQWCDAATVNLIHYIFSMDTLQYALFVCAYRDNELQAGHRIYQSFRKLRELNSCTELILKPLEFNAVNDLVSETLHSPPDETKPLTELIFKKTNGNPLFTINLLKSLYLQKAFIHIPEKGQWSFDLEKVKKAEISDNVIDLIIKSIESLPESTINTLKLASCIGNRFGIRTLFLLKNCSGTLLYNDIRTAINKEIIVPLDSNYRLISNMNAETYKDVPIHFCFTHDRVRQVVYSLLTDNEKAKIHLSIGYIFLKVYREEEHTDLLYELVNHLYIGRELIHNINERIELSDLNILAGNKAKKSTAYAAAENYFAVAQSLLSDELWAKTPRKYFNLLLERANVALLSGNLTLSENLCNRLSDKAQSNIDKASVSIIRIQIFEYQGKHKEAIDEVRRSLRLFDIHLPENDQEIAQKIQEGIFKLKGYLAQRTIDELKKLPEMNDPEKLIIMQMVFQMVPAAYQSNPPLFVLSSLMIFELTCNYGVSPLSCKCFTDCAIILGAALGDYETAYSLAEAAFSLLNRLEAEAFRAAVYYGFTFTSYMRAHYSESLGYYDMAFHKGLETGDIHHAAFALADKLLLLLFTGKNLAECMQETENAITYLNKINISMPQLLTQIVHYMIQKFQTIHDAEKEKIFLQKDEELLVKLKSSNDLGFLCRFFSLNIYMNIIYGKMGDAEKWNSMAQEITESAGFIQDYSIIDYHMYHGLILCSKWAALGKNEKAAARETLTNIQQKLKTWMENCPANFAHKYYLLSARIAIIDGAPIDTVDELFRKALDSIGSNDFIQFRALCNELYGQFWLTKGNKAIGMMYIREAYYLYQQWGANGKVIQMEKQYPDYLKVNQEYRRLTMISSYTTQNSIDMISIIKGAQAISSEIKTEKLLTTFIKTIIENAGAQKGFLLLKNEHDNKLYIEAKKGDNTDHPQVMQSLPYAQSSELCPEIIQYVARTKETIVANNASSEGIWRDNPYIANNKVKSVLCMPVIYQTRFIGVVYLENNLSDNVFTFERLEILKILSTQAAISIENAMLYKNMEERIKERTAQLDKANEKLRELSFHDPLTGLYNRRYTFQFISRRVSSFIHIKKRLLENIERREISSTDNVIGIFLIDIDHFKDVNDTYGHSAGDSTLVLISNLLKDMIRSDDYLVRWGGEEFLIILFDTKREYLDVFSKEVLERVRETPFKISNSINIHKTCSLGCVDIPLDPSNPDLLNMEQMINLSDYALYYAKEHGRNCGVHLKYKETAKLDKHIIKDLTDFRASMNKIEDYFDINIIT